MGASAWSAIIEAVRSRVPARRVGLRRQCLNITDAVLDAAGQCSPAHSVQDACGCNAPVKECLQLFPPELNLRFSTGGFPVRTQTVVAQFDRDEVLQSCDKRKKPVKPRPMHVHVRATKQIDELLLITNTRFRVHTG